MNHEEMTLQCACAALTGLLARNHDPADSSPTITPLVDVSFEIANAMMQHVVKERTYPFGNPLP